MAKTVAVDHGYTIPSTSGVGTPHVQRLVALSRVDVLIGIHEVGHRVHEQHLIATINTLTIGSGECVRVVRNGSYAHAHARTHTRAPAHTH